jgi:fructokinase
VTGAYVHHEGEGFGKPSPKVKVADTVGAGDAFHGRLYQYLHGEWRRRAALEKALRLGAFVASHRGAQPAYEPADVLG